MFAIQRSHLASQRLAVGIAGLNIERKGVFRSSNTNSSGKPGTSYWKQLAPHAIVEQKEGANRFLLEKPMLALSPLKPIFIGKWLRWIKRQLTFSHYTLMDCRENGQVEIKNKNNAVCCKQGMHPTDKLQKL